MTTTGVAARYDGFADWYEAFNAPHATTNRPELEHTLGAGEGLCLDLGCGTGLYFETLPAPPHDRLPRPWDHPAGPSPPGPQRASCPCCSAGCAPVTIGITGAAPRSTGVACGP
jgi:hypothetical protein